ncbi:hypothetical protein PG1780B_1608 [Bifidobacterium pseudolongum subsp. globosum]|uniref:Uncharacterized protein n=1 Tax=Bifidobacterium pseudolongum subsp. globosum TaxID=1690 RepID=A0A8B3RM27_9BIFI|nr:hypothetical protein PG1780B_1608 [Bifidobacterium pseudolongum subsp. globosum]
MAKIRGLSPVTSLHEVTQITYISRSRCRHIRQQNVINGSTILQHHFTEPVEVATVPLTVFHVDRSTIKIRPLQTRFFLTTVSNRLSHTTSTRLDMSSSQPSGGELIFQRFETLLMSKPEKYLPVLVTGFLALLQLENRRNHSEVGENLLKVRCGITRLFRKCQHPVTRTSGLRTARFCHFYDLCLRL